MFSGIPVYIHFQNAIHGNNLFPFEKIYYIKHNLKKILVKHSSIFLFTEKLLLISLKNTKAEYVKIEVPIMHLNIFM